MPNLADRLNGLMPHELASLRRMINARLAGEFYADPNQLYDYFGQTNIYRWANLDNLPTYDPSYETDTEARINDALEQATVEMQEKLRPSGLDVPADGNQPIVYSRICCYLAGVQLYEARGTEDYDFKDGKSVHKYMFLYDRAQKALDDMASDKRRADLQDTPLPIRAPGVVK